jgi:hypothetical protein
VPGDILGDIVRNFQPAKLSLLLHDGNPRFIARLVYPYYQTPVEPADKTSLERWYLGWRTIGAENELLAVVVQGVECVKELLLALLTLTEELHIIYHEGIDGAELTLKAGQISFLDSPDKSVDELLTA